MFVYSYMCIYAYICILYVCLCVCVCVFATVLLVVYECMNTYYMHMYMCVWQEIQKYPVENMSIYSYVYAHKYILCVCVFVCVCMKWK